MHRVLVSACLLGLKVRYNGSDRLHGHPVLARWQAEGRVVALCPELAAGFATPRPPAEIRGGTGDDVLHGTARVVEDTGRDVTGLYGDGARIALELARRHGCRHAVLTDGSPSCGSGFVYDGSFAGLTRPGTGVTASLLRANGIRVFAETAIDELDRLLSAAEGR